MLMSFVSPVLVGRAAEVGALDAAVARARAGVGGTVFVVGEAGIGKSRLAATAGGAGVRVVRGRAGSVPLRAVSEAVLGALRDGSVDRERLGGFWPVLWRLVSDRTEALTDPPLVRAEAVLRLLAQLGTCVLTLEDLHDADADTLHVVDYLADNVGDQPVVVVGTARPDPGPAHDVIASAVARRAATVLRLAPLDRAATGELVHRCLDGPVPDELLDRVHRNADGVPFVVEEMLGALVDDGTLVRMPDGWRLTGDPGDPGARVPATVAAAVQRRVDRLGPGATEVLRAAAVFGRTFSLSAAAATAGIDATDAVGHLRAAAGAQLVAAEPGDDPDRYAFRHALTAEAVLAGLLPVERAGLARTAAAVVEPVDGQEEVAAALWLTADEPGRAAELLRRAGRRAAARGTLAASTALLERGLSLVDTRDGSETTAGLLEALVHTLVESGDIERVRALGSTLDGALSRVDASPARRVAARLTRARAGGASGLWRDGLAEIAAARALAGGEPALVAEIDAVASRLVFLSDHPEGDTEARRLAEAALATATAADLPEVACEALEILSRCARLTDLAAAQAHLGRVAELAERHSLPIWRVRAFMEIAAIEKDRTNDVSGLLVIRQAVEDAGAVVTAAWVDFNLGVAAVFAGDLVAAERYCDRALATARRFRRIDLERIGLCGRAVLAACRADRAGMERALAQLEGVDLFGYGPEVWGYLRAVCALLEEDHDRALEHFADADAASAAIGHRRGFGHRAPYLLLRAAGGHATWADHDALLGTNLMQMSLHRSYVLWTRAVLFGRDGKPDDAAQAAAEAMESGAAVPLNRYLGTRIAAPCALADGWGEPLTWLRDTEEYFHGAGLTQPAAACRALLRGAGVGGQQRRAGYGAVPPVLRRAGVTVREYDVLRLVGERLGNIEIAERLFLSPRTVERHVASLRQRTGQPDRAHLVEYARRHAK
ncbi:hypothetical protein Voc01_027750 [Virgisporangium ochraceum]|uniref:HTH luxR-type domain-containing protein n=2 Tax=Virgisporangium ochraceum TaxID=65505 RepID=A0A8J4EAW9_9ACTN|nr:hypothetical protein Voc01_027750 [Virgisporangium ochraceum]